MIPSKKIHSTSKEFLVVVTLFVTLSWAVPSRAEESNRRPPNVLIILSDDQGFAEFGAYADFADPKTLMAKDIEELRAVTEVTKTKVPVDVALAAARKSTPNIDKLAAEGTRFTSFYAAPTCGPARGALMTGRYPQRYGVYTNHDIEDSKNPRGFPEESEFLAQRFQKAGFRTGLVGKWHLGSKPGQHPNDRGFESFFGFDRAHVDKYDSTMLFRNRDKIPAEGWLEDQISNEAVAFLERNRDDARPFFLYVAYNVPHGPIPPPPEEYMKHINSGSLAVDAYFGAIYGMDVGIGRIIATLKEQGELDNTLIFIGSDNGLAQGVFHRGFFAEGDRHFSPIPGNGPFRGCKWTPWEGGVRVPFIARVPGGKAGQSSDAVQSIMDVIPTAMEYCSLETPKAGELDGVSFLSVLTDGPPKTDGRMLFWASDSQEPFGDFRSEIAALIDAKKRNRGSSESPRDNYPPAWYARSANWKLMGWDDLAPVLIDIRNDPSELHDVAAQNPEVVRELQAKFAVWMQNNPAPVHYPERQWEKLKSIR